MKDNKLIAEFMELEASPKYNPKEYYVRKYNSGEWYLPEEMEYHSSWDRLMPVVQKCYESGAEGDCIGDITMYLTDTDIQGTYKAVVEFIKDYNKQPKDYDWCSDSGHSDVFDSHCECTAPQVDEGMCICGRPINQKPSSDDRDYVDYA